MESVGRLRLQGLAVLAVAMLVGGVVGVTVERMRAAAQAPEVASRWARGGPNGRGGPRPGFDRGDGIPGFFGELNLTAEQRDEIREVFEARGPLTDSVMRSAFGQIEAIRESVLAEINAILTTEQREILEDRMGNRLPFGGRFDGQRRGRGRPGAQRDRR